jgi:hypothetical protein
VPIREFDADLISEKQAFLSQEIPAAAADVFATDVPDDRQRMIYGFIISGDAANPALLNLRKLEADGVTLTDYALGIAIAAGSSQFWPTQPDPMKPILVLEGGTNLQSDDSMGAGAAAHLTVLYWDR